MVTIDGYGDFVSVEEFVDVTQMPKSTVYKLIKNPGFPCIQQPGFTAIHLKKAIEWLLQPENRVFRRRRKAGNDGD